MTKVSRTFRIDQALSTALDKVRHTHRNKVTNATESITHHIEHALAQYGPIKAAMGVSEPKPEIYDKSVWDQGPLGGGAMFDWFWAAGMKKTNKKKAHSLFKSLLKKQDDAVVFTRMLIADVEARLNSNQLGFAEMHPTTYLNGERWNDEVTTNAENQKSNQGRRPSAVDRVGQATERARAERAAASIPGGAMEEPVSNAGQQLYQSVRGVDAGRVGQTIDGTYCETDD